MAIGEREVIIGGNSCVAGITIPGGFLSKTVTQFQKRYLQHTMTPTLISTPPPSSHILNFNYSTKSSSMVPNPKKRPRFSSDVEKMASSSGNTGSTHSRKKRKLLSSVRRDSTPSRPSPLGKRHQMGSSSQQDSKHHTTQHSLITPPPNSHKSASVTNQSSASLDTPPFISIDSPLPFRDDDLKVGKCDFDAGVSTTGTTSGNQQQQNYGNEPVVSASHRADAHQSDTSSDKQKLRTSFTNCHSLNEHHKVSSSSSSPAKPHFTSPYYSLQFLPYHLIANTSTKGSLASSASNSLTPKQHPYLEIRFFHHKQIRDVLDHIQKQWNCKVNIYSFRRKFLFSDTLSTVENSENLFSENFSTFLKDKKGNQSVQLFYEVIPDTRREDEFLSAVTTGGESLSYSPGVLKQVMPSASARMQPLGGESNGETSGSTSNSFMNAIMMEDDNASLGSFRGPFIHEGTEDGSHLSGTNLNFTDSFGDESSDFWGAVKDNSGLTSSRNGILPATRSEASKGFLDSPLLH